MGGAGGGDMYAYSISRTGQKKMQKSKGYWGQKQEKDCEYYL